MYVSNFVQQEFSVIVPFHWFEEKKLFPSNQKLSSRFIPLQTRLEKILPDVFLASFWDVTF